MGRIMVEISQEGGTSLAIDYAYDPSIQQHRFTGAFENITPARAVGETAANSGFGAAAIINLPLTGKAEVIFDETLKLIKATAQIHGSEGTLVNAAFWDAPCPVKSLDLDIKYNRATRKLTVSTAHMDFNGPTLNIKINGKDRQKKGTILILQPK